MTFAYWIVAGLLAVFFVYAGGIKVVQSPEKLRPMMAWVDSVPLGGANHRRPGGSLCCRPDPAAVDRYRTVAGVGFGDRARADPDRRDRPACQSG